MSKERKPNCKCLRCGKQWKSYKSIPLICPECKSKLWNIPVHERSKGRISIEKMLSSNTKLPLLFAIMVGHLEARMRFVKESELAKNLQVSQASVSNYLNQLRQMKLLNENRIVIDQLVAYFWEYFDRNVSKDRLLKKPYIGSPFFKRYFKAIQKSDKSIKPDRNVKYRLILRQIINDDFKSLLTEYAMYHAQHGVSYSFYELFEMFIIKFQTGYINGLIELDALKKTSKKRYETAIKAGDALIKAGDEFCKQISLRFPNIALSSESRYLEYLRKSYYIK